MNFFVPYCPSQSDMRVFYPIQLGKTNIYNLNVLFGIPYQFITLSVRILNMIPLSSTIITAKNQLLEIPI